MPEQKINDRKLIRLIDIDLLSQSEAARKLGVSRQAVSKRLLDLRGKTTRAVVIHARPKGRFAENATPCPVTAGRKA